MNTIKKTLILLIAFLPIAVSAQNNKIPQRLEIVESGACEVFNMPKDGQNHYYLSVGNLGIGNDIVQVKFDPAFELFIPLGNTLTEAIETLSELKAFCKQPRKTSKTTQGCLALAFPTGETETVTVTTRHLLLQRRLEFSVEREGYIRATYIAKSDIGSMLSGVKLYRKIHPKEDATEK